MTPSLCILGLYGSRSTVLATYFGVIEFIDIPLYCSEKSSIMINFMMTFTLGRFQSYLFEILVLLLSEWEFHHSSSNMISKHDLMSNCWMIQAFYICSTVQQLKWDKGKFKIQTPPEPIETHERTNVFKNATFSFWLNAPSFVFSVTTQGKWTSRYFSIFLLQNNDLSTTLCILNIFLHKHLYMIYIYAYLH